MESFSTYAFFQSAVDVPPLLAATSQLSSPVGFFLRADPVSSKSLIQVFIACFEGTWPWRPKLKTNAVTPSAHLPNYLCLCKTFLCRKHAVDRSTVSWLLDGKVVCSSTFLFCSAANCARLPLPISKVPVLLCHPVCYCISYSVTNITNNTEVSIGNERGRGYENTKFYVHDVGYLEKALSDD